MSTRSDTVFTVREVCDLCGARWEPEADACRECGNTRARPSPSQVTELPKPPAALVARPSSSLTTRDDGPAPPPLDPARLEVRGVEAAPEPLADPTSMELDRLVVEPRRRRSTLWLGLLLASGAAVGVATMMLRSPGPEPQVPAPKPIPPPPDADLEATRPVIDPCEGADALAGRWSFTTEVTAARELLYSGVRGFYDVTFDVQGCEVTAEVTKTGYTGGFYPERRILRGKAPLLRQPGPFEFGFAGRFKLSDATGDGPEQDFVFVARNDRLYGTWRQRGTRWETQGLSGFLEGEREPDGRVTPRLPEQPCDIRCAIACDTAQFENVEQFDGCVAECSDEDPELPSCGEPLPSQWQLELDGPSKTLDEHCRRLSVPAAPGTKKRRAPTKLHCEKAPPTAGGFAFALLSNKLDGDWREIRFVRTGPEETPTVHLALRVPDGWYVSSPLLSGPEAADLSHAELVARDLADGEGRRHVFGYIGGPTRVSFVSCRLAEADPSCVVIESEGPPNRSTALPGGMVSAGSPRPVDGDAPPPSPGPYAW